MAGSQRCAFSVLGWFMASQFGTPGFISVRADQMDALMTRSGSNAWPDWGYRGHVASSTKWFDVEGREAIGVTSHHLIPLK